MTPRERQVNLAAEFLPMDGEPDGAPTVEVGGAYVSVFWAGGKLRVWIGLEEVLPEFKRGDDLVPMEITVGPGSVLDTDAEGRITHGQAFYAPPF